MKVLHIDSSLNAGSAALPHAAKAVTERTTEGRDLNVAVHGLRGIAALMVLCAHVLGGTAEHIYNRSIGYVEGSEPYWNFGIFGVMLFFAISGYVILPSVLKYSAKDFALRRFMRIYPLFFAATITFAVLNLFTNAYPESNNLQSLVYSLLFLDLFTSTEQIAPNAWSLTYEVMFYSIACLTMVVFSSQRSGVLKCLYVVIPIGFMILFPRSIFFLVGAAVFFLDRRGMLERVPLANFIEIGALLACIFSASREKFNYHLDEFQNPLVLVIIVSLGVYFSMAVRRRSITSKVLNNRAALYLGTVSYSLYLVHPYTYFICRHLFDYLGLFTSNIVTSMSLFYAAVVPTSLLAAHVVYTFLERWPYQWFFKQRIYRTRSSTG
jgi:peptidoglycan/LPS O-acetylase OafA/YrhL